MGDLSKKIEREYPKKEHPLLSFFCTSYMLVFYIVLYWPLAWLVQFAYFHSFGKFASPKTRRTVCGNIFRWQLLSLWLNPFWNVKTIGEKPKLPSGAIFMSNHLTFADPFITSDLIWPVDAKYVSVHDAFKIPLAGGMAKRAGDLPIKFVKQPTGSERKYITDKDVLEKTMKKAAEYLNNGENIFVFPEGKLSKSGELREFKGNGFFQLAIDSEASIVPIAMWGNQSLYLHGSVTPQPGYAEAKFGEPIKVSSTDDIVELKLKVRNAIVELRDSLPLYQSTVTNVNRDDIEIVPHYDNRDDTEIVPHYDFGVNF